MHLLSTTYMAGFPGGSAGKETACNVGDLPLIPGLGRSPGGGHDNPLQYSCLENPHGQYSLPDSSAHKILQARILERVAVPFSKGSFQPRDPTQVSHIAGSFFTV